VASSTDIANGQSVSIVWTDPISPVTLLTKTTTQAQAALYRKPLSRRPRPTLRC
jgi:hypothetical protein